MLVELQVQVVQVLEPPHRAVLSLLALQFPEAPSQGYSSELAGRTMFSAVKIGTPP